MTATAAPAAPPAPAELTREQKTFTLVGALLGLLLFALDQTIVSTAGPAIQRDLAIEPSLYVWLTTAYLVASTVMVPIYGKLSDLKGRRPILVFGILLFLLGSLLCGLSGSAVALILFRALQGLGAAALFVSAFSVIADIFPPAERGKYTGLFGAVFGLSSVLGPLIGGFLTDAVGWHWVFFVNLPIGAVALAFILTRMPVLRRPQPPGSRLDVAGALLIVLAAVPLLLALSLGKTEVGPGETGLEWGSWRILGMFALSALATLAFVAVEARVKDPLLDLRLFRIPTFRIGTLASFLLGASFLGPIVFLPLFMVNVVGLSATSSGLTIMPLTFGLIAGNVLSGQLASRTGRYKPLMLGGLGLLLVGFAVMAFTLTPESTQLELTLKMILVGLGLGPAIPLYTLAIQNATPAQNLGVATSMASFARSMGSTIGVALLGTVFATSLSSGIGSRVAEATADVPPALRAQFAAGGSGNVGAAEGGPTGVAFDASAVRAGIARGFDERRALLTRALGDADPDAARTLLASPQTDERLRELLRDPAALPAPARQDALRGALAGLEAGREAALETADRVGVAIRQAFTTAVSSIFVYALGLAVLGLLVTLAIPELPLRKTNAGPPPVE